MITPQATVVAILVAKTHFSQSAAEAFVKELTDADLAALIECNALPAAKAHINSYLDLVAAKQAAVHCADPQLQQRADQGVARANAEFVAGVKASQAVQKPAVSETPSPASAVSETPAAPESVSQETSPSNPPKKPKRG